MTAKEAMDALEALLNEPNVTTSMIDDILEDVPVIDTNRYTWCKKMFIRRLVEKEMLWNWKKQITNEELLELTKKAFENNEVAEFLCGEKG